MLFLDILEICLVNPNTWSNVNSAMRSFIEYLIAVVILLSVPAGRLGARFAWVLPHSAPGWSRWAPGWCTGG